MTIGLDFFDNPIAIHFPAVKGPFIVVWVDKFKALGPAFNTNAQLFVSGSLLSLPSRTIIQPSPLILTGQGAPPPAQGPAPPVTDTFTAAMRKQYQSWIGTNKTFNDQGTPVDTDQMGYMIFNPAARKHGAADAPLTSVSFNLSYQSDTGGGPAEVVVATYKNLASVAYRHDFISGQSFDGLTVVPLDPKGKPLPAEFVGDNSGFFDPALAPNAIDLQGRTTFALTKNWSVFVSLNTLAITMSA